jgi:hypothetical protein
MKHPVPGSQFIEPPLIGGRKGEGVYITYSSITSLSASSQAVWQWQGEQLHYEWKNLFSWQLLVIRCCIYVPVHRVSGPLLTTEPMLKSFYWLSNKWREFWRENGRFLIFLLLILLILFQILTTNGFPQLREAAANGMNNIEQFTS